MNFEGIANSSIGTELQKIARVRNDMEKLLNFYQAQTPLGVFAPVLFFFGLLVFLCENLRRETPSALLASAVLLPLLFCSRASVQHLPLVRNAFQGDATDILNPAADTTCDRTSLGRLWHVSCSRNDRGILCVDDKTGRERRE